MIYLVLLSITILFFTFALIITPFFKKHFGIKICAICAACSLTWTTLLILRFFNITEVDNALIAVLMGGSVVGIMFELQKYFRKHTLKNFWIVRILEVTCGFYLAYSLAIWNTSMILIGGCLALIVLIITLMLSKRSQDKTEKSEFKKDELSEEEKQSAIKKLEKDLEDCC